jgi:hypothetical protein
MTELQTSDKAAALAAQGAHDAPQKDSSKKGTGRKQRAPKGQKAAKAAKPKATPKSTAKTSRKAGKSPRVKEPRPPRAESKGAQILDMIGRAKGATLAEIMAAADWQAHSVRGFISSAAKKHSIKIESSKNEAGERVYHIAK